MVFAWAVFAYSAYYNKVKRQCFGLLDCPGQPSLAECLCLLPGLLFVRVSRLPFPFSAFGRPAAPAFCRRAEWPRRQPPPPRQRCPRRVLPAKQPPGTGRPAVLLLCAALCPPCEQACLERKILLETMDCYLNANYPNQLNGAMSVISEMNFRYLAWHCFIDNTTSHPLSLRFPSPQNASGSPWRGRCGRRRRSPARPAPVGLG